MDQNEKCIVDQQWNGTKSINEEQVHESIPSKLMLKISYFVAVIVIMITLLSVNIKCCSSSICD